MICVFITFSFKFFGNLFHQTLFFKLYFTHVVAHVVCLPHVEVATRILIEHSVIFLERNSQSKDYVQII